MSTVVLLTLTGLGLGAMYFLIASGLSLIYGLMGVLNFAHGAFITVGAYSSWWLSGQIDGLDSTVLRFLLGAVFGLVIGAVLAALVEFVLIRPLYLRHIEQVLVTVGLSLALIALVQAIWGPTERVYTVPGWLFETTEVLGARVPNDRFVEIGVAVAALVGIICFLRYTRYGLIIRAGVENRAMVTALGIDVRRAFTLVFAIGGVAAALAGVLAAVYFGGSIEPERGTSLLIFAFIVVVIGGLGSIGGSAVAAVVVALVQQYANYYGTRYLDTSGVGDLAVVLLLALTLLVRPSGIAGKWAVAH